MVRSNLNMSWGSGTRIRGKSLYGEDKGAGVLYSEGKGHSVTD